MFTLLFNNVQLTAENKYHNQKDNFLTRLASLFPRFQFYLLYIHTYTDSTICGWSDVLNFRQLDLCIYDIYLYKYK